jgi:hypothetical protein
MAAKGFNFQVPTILGTLTNFGFFLKTADFPRLSINGQDPDGKGFLNGGGNFRIYTNRTKSVEVPAELISFVTGNDAKILIFVSYTCSTGTVFYIEADEVATARPLPNEPYGSQAANPYPRYHLKGTADDSSAFQSHADPLARLFYPMTLGQGMNLEGANEVRGSVPITALNFSTGYHLSMWINPDNDGLQSAYATAFGVSGGGSSNLVLQRANTNSYWRLRHGSTTVNFPNGTFSGITLVQSRQKIDLTWNGTTAFLYVNSSLKATIAISDSNIYDASNTPFFGSALKGIVEEVSFTPIYRGQNWITTEYLNQNCTGAWGKIGAWATGGGSDPVPLPMLPSSTTKIGVLFAGEEMGVGESPYFPDILNAEALSTLGTPFPTKFSFYLITSSDHSVGAGGLYLHLCEGDPSVLTNWISYTDAVIAGDFDYLVSKPAANPIYQDTVAGQQTETPCVNIFDGVMYITWHNSQNYSVDSITTQNTVLGISTDGVNITRKGRILSYSPKYGRGDGHTGYLGWRENIFTQIKNPLTGNPWNYIGTAIHGGSDWSYGCVWVTDELLDGSGNPVLWQPYSYAKGDYGSISDNVLRGYPVVVAGQDPKDIFSNNDGTYSGFGSVTRKDTNATQTPDSETYLTLIDSQFRQIGIPRKILGIGGISDFDYRNAANVRKLTYSGNDYLIYQGRDGGAGTGNNAIGIAQLHYEQGWIVGIDRRTYLFEHKFKGYSELPTEILTYGSDGVLTFDTVKGLQITIPAGGTSGLVFPSFNTITKTGDTDVYIEGIQQNIPEICDVRLGFYADPALLNAANNYVEIHNTNTANLELKWNKGGSVFTQTLSDQLGYGTSYGTSKESSQADVPLGLRFSPRNGCCYFLTANRTERDKADMRKFSADFTPVLKLTNNGSNPVTFSIPSAIFDGAVSTIPNTPPTANAGPDQANKNVGDTITLNGLLSSDPDVDTILEYSWLQTAGPTQSLNDSTLAEPTFTIAKTANYEDFREDDEIEWQLTVYDGQDFSLPDVMSIFVNGTNQPPTAGTTTTQSVAAGSNVTVAAVGHGDPDVGDTLTYSWLKTSGPTATLSGTNTDTLTFTAPISPSSSVFTFDFTISDGLESDTITHTVNVAAEAGAPDTTKPVIVLSPSTLTYNLNVGDTFTLPTATLTDNVDPTISISPVSNNVNMAAPGVYSVVYSDYQDAAGNVANSVTITVNVAAVAIPDTTKPVIVLSPSTLTYNLNVGDTFTLPTATLTDNVDPTISISPVSDNVNMAAPGVYNVVYSGYQDAAGNVANSVTITVNVAAVAIPDTTKPVIVLSPSTLTYNLNVGDTFTLPTATLTDNVDPTISISPVSNNVNMAAPGVYSVVYSGYQDAAGNVADAVTITVNVALDLANAPFNRLSFNVNLSGPIAQSSSILGTLFTGSDTIITITINDGYFNPRQFSNIKFGIYSLTGTTPEILKSLGNGIVIEGNAIAVTLAAIEIPIFNNVYFELSGSGATNIHIKSGFLKVSITRL